MKYPELVYLLVQRQLQVVHAVEDIAMVQMLAGPLRWVLASPTFRGRMRSL